MVSTKERGRTIKRKPASDLAKEETTFHRSFSFKKHLLSFSIINVMFSDGDMFIRLCEQQQPSVAEVEHAACIYFWYILQKGVSFPMIQV